jgi:hypothetical protein
VLSSAFQTCKPLQSLSDVSALLYTAQKPWLYLSEGNCACATNLLLAYLPVVVALLCSLVPSARRAAVCFCLPIEGD